MAAPVGVVSSRGTSTRETGASAEQLDHRRRRQWDDPVGRGRRTHAGGDRTAEDEVDAEQLERRAGADHVDDGVEPADLVEVDVLGSLAVQGALDFGQADEDPRRPLPDALGQIGTVHQRHDLARCA